MLLIQDNQIILSDTFKFDTETNQLDIENLSIEFTTEKTPTNLRKSN